MSENIFVYGTLRKDATHSVYKSMLAPFSEFIGYASVPGYLYAVAGFPGYIAVSPEKTDSRVFGEIHRLNDFETAICSLDRYEGFNPIYPRGSLYLRKEVKAKIENGSKYGDIIPTFIYEYNNRYTHKPLITSGNFLDWEREHV